MKYIVAHLVMFITALLGLGDKNPPATGPSLGRARVRDAYGAFKYRMGAGFPGDVNRTHPASIEPCLIDAEDPPLQYGGAVVVNPTTNSVRQVTDSDISLDDIYGFVVRSYPLQQTSGGMASSFGVGTPPVSGVIDIMRTGYIMSQLGDPSGNAAATKGGRVYIWVDASTGAHVQGLPETEPTTGSTIELPPTTLFNGPADSNGVVEISVI